MNAKQRQKQYLIAKGLIKPPPDSFRKTEGSTVFQYPKEVADAFAKWSALRRVQNKTFLFQEFYDELFVEQKNKITITILNQ